MAELRPVHQAAASCTGALITSLFMTPFDVVKVRLQAQQRAALTRSCFLYCNGLMDHICRCAHTLCSHPPDAAWYNRPVPLHLNGTVDAFIKISRQEGVASLWSGLSPTLVVALPNTIIYFTTYEQLRNAFHKHLQPGQPQPSSWLGGLAGGLARVWSVTLVSPFELVRTKMQSESISYREIMKVLEAEVRSSGVRSLWRGWVPTVLRDVPFSVVYWYCYEKQKAVLRKPQPSFQFSMMAGAVAGGVAGTLTLPLDVIKTHKQIEIGVSRNNGSVWQLLDHIYQQQGVRGLFSGLVPRLAKVMPACAIMISTYEYTKRFFTHQLHATDPPNPHIQQH